MCRPAVRRANPTANPSANPFYEVLFCAVLLTPGGCRMRDGSSEQLVIPEVVRTNLYVAPGGSDANPGTQAEPFRTIKRAAQVVTQEDRDALRAKRVDDGCHTDCQTGAIQS